MTQTRKRLAVLVLLCVLLAACSGSNEPPSLDGRWDGGEDWGEVIIDGLAGTYSSTFGDDLGEISLELVSGSDYIGTWNEGGTLRFGTLEISLDSDKKVTGNWTADPTSQISGSNGGLLLWER